MGSKPYLEARHEHGTAVAGASGDGPLVVGGRLGRGLPPLRVHQHRQCTKEGGLMDVACGRKGRALQSRGGGEDVVQTTKAKE